MKDNFSTDSDKYALYRPAYPEEFYEYLDTITNGKDNAWDCATGNGQVARQLASRYTHVYATDISQQQLDHAPVLPNIHYSLQPAESTQFRDNFFDLITVAQAVHWFQFQQFYSEVKRTAKPNALLVVLGYGKINIAPELDWVIDHLYGVIIGRYWDAERKYVDEAYKTIPFPFEELQVPAFSISYTWTLEQVFGYLQTWSAVKHYQQKHGHNPVDLVADELKSKWGERKESDVHFPLLLRIGKV